MPSNRQPHGSTTADELDRFAEELAHRGQDYAQTSVRTRIELAESCADGVWKMARQWVDAACSSKSIPADSPQRAEDILTGPVATLRYLRLLLCSLRHIEKNGRPQLPGRPYRAEDGRLRVPVVPADGLFDRLILSPYRATAWMQEGVTEDNLPDHLGTHYRAIGCQPAKTTLVLGAGNVSSIPATDTFSKLFHEGSVVLLKMNPVNEYLGPVFEQAFSALIDNGYLRIIYGGPDVGATAINHGLVDSIHITGSLNAHERIVWGPPGREADQRRKTNTPLLQKPITSELGNVSPWIVVPGDYSNRQLAFQAENIVASVTNNASFNCVATKVIITWKRWPMRKRFLDSVKGIFAQVPRRVAYYPGAIDRFCDFTNTQRSSLQSDSLPWTLVCDVQPEEAPRFFEEESFVCVLVEIALDAPTEEEFFRKAVDFANERLMGTLCATVTLPPRFRRQPANEQLLQSCLGNLRYGVIGVNHWPGLVYAMMAPPWGGHPGSSLQDVQSGIGWVHNTFMLENVEKTVLEGPLTVFPKPVWFPSHNCPEALAWALLRLYHKPSLFRLPGVVANALRG